MPGRRKKGIEKCAGKVKDCFKSVSNKMVEGIEKGVNGVIGGVNWAWHKLGGTKEKFKPWTMPKYAKGTDGHPGGPAVLGDGKNSNTGRELVQLPSGRQFLTEDKPTIYTN